MDLEADWARLFALIDEARDLLEGSGVEDWADWLDQRARGLRSFGFNGIESFLQGFGGMGSFNDLLVLAFNGHKITPSDENAVNARLDQLRADMYRTAQRIRTNTV